MQKYVNSVIVSPLIYVRFYRKKECEKFSQFSISWSLFQMTQTIKPV
jgi:hypothetical protein